MAIWVTSDTHFGHDNIIRYCGRPFLDAREMDEALVARWNAVVAPSDEVYHLGDVAMRREGLDVVRRLHGHKRLIGGNHDIFSTADYLRAGFEEVRGLRVLANVLLSHIPIHPDAMGRYVGNIHGHLHEKAAPAGPYFNVSVEHTDYQPIPLAEAVRRLSLRPRVGTPGEVCLVAAVRVGTQVIRCHRHHQGLALLTGHERAEQGFVTTTGRFVGRDEGRQLQAAAGVPSVAPGGYRGDLLYSEDLY